MQAVGADQEIKAPFARMLQRDTNAVRLLLERGDLITEDGFDAVSELAKEQSRQSAARERHEPSSGQLGKDGSAEARNAVPGVVDDADLPNVITDAIDFRDQPHALRKIAAKSPEIDDIAAAAQGGARSTIVGS
jgi:hypothetical protein